MITPESVEVMLISAKTDARALFQNLSAIIIDEVHAFADDDRGAHLVAILERLSRFCGRDIQRIGLSATVGNPTEIGKWLQGSSTREFALVDPPKPKAERDLRIHYVMDLFDAAPDMAKIARGKKSLVFTESRASAERVTRALDGRGVDVFVHHSSVSRFDRTFAEEQLAQGKNTAIVATSTMELGIDVGDLDHVIQVGSPSSVASFLQRLGRTGRRSGTVANAAFFCDKSEDLLQAIAILRLADRDWVEDVTPAADATHVLAHQILALTLQQGGLSRHQVLPWLSTASPFAGLGDDRVQRLVDTMVEREILHQSDGLQSLGHEGERLYARKNFFELYGVFSAPPVLRVMNGRSEIGYIQAFFLQAFHDEDGPSIFRLGGNAWQVKHVEWRRGQVFVKPATGGRVPRWLGQPHQLSWALCQEILSLIWEPGDEAQWLDEGAQLELAAIRMGYEGLLEPGTAPIENVDHGVQWHTYAGGAVNHLLASALHDLTGEKWTPGNFSLKAADVSLAEGRAAIRELTGVDWDGVAADVAKDMSRGAVSKFQPCLPEDEENALLVSKLLDVERTRWFLENVRVL